MREITNSTNETSSKIMFANQLRGLAVLSVVVAHYIGVYWFGRSTVAQYILAPLAEGPPPRVFPYIFVGSFNPGPFGVALFFLISGFVIPFSLEKLGVARFAIARLLRIFPTYWIATAFMLSVVAASGGYWGNQMFFHSKEIIPNLFLVHSQLGIPTIDLVNWTLTIEMMFYICAIILWPAIHRSSTLVLVGFAVCILALITWVPPGSAMWDTTKYELMMVTFLFIGTLFNFSLRGAIPNSHLVGGVLFIGLAFAMMWQKTILAPQFWQVPANYGYALLVFSVCFTLRSKFKPSRVLDFFAAISYPLYLTHSIPGYVIIRILMAHGIRFSLAASFAFLLVVLVAYILHVGVELPTANLGKRLSRRRQDHPLPTNAA